ncbi:MAG TPA: hypothetical protein VM778_03815 [Gemmatimonadota bacterium]|nr:hypothetical protein [Gemmatimonadota bacterium]
MANPHPHLTAARLRDGHVVDLEDVGTSCAVEAHGTHERRVGALGAVVKEAGKTRLSGVVGGFA